MSLRKRLEEWREGLAYRKEHAMDPDNIYRFCETEYQRGSATEEVLETVLYELGRILDPQEEDD